ncbi:uncharacterized protein [Battus philenor]|uniref:uncharacterized protein n=1 Tax=Battus philenor TaxID=42288 RepID=UPI0035D0659B
MTGPALPASKVHPTPVGRIHAASTSLWSPVENLSQWKGLCSVRYAGAEWARETTKGCVHGSVGGPAFWTLLINPLPEEVVKGGTYWQAFADEVVLVFSGQKAQDISSKANEVLAHIHEWGVKNKLRFAPHKTKVMVLTNKLKYDTPLLTMGGEPLGHTREVRILVITIDDRLTYNSHVKNVCRKAEGLYRQLCRAAKVSWSLNSEVIRTMYLAVLEPIILYGASAWAPAARKLMDLKVQEAAELFPSDRELETLESFLRLPHPSVQIGVEFSCLGENAEEVQLATGATDLAIYTDGSIDDKVDAAFCVTRDAVELKTKKLKLRNFCTVYQAELLALMYATGHAASGSQKRVAIFSDSRSAIETVAKSDTLYPLACSIKENVMDARKKGKEVKLYWLKAHAGTEGNERADQLAKDAALKSKKKPEYEMMLHLICQATA